MMSRVVSLGEDASMQTKFDPNATPKCNKLIASAAGYYSWRDAAKELEKRARIAEEKLRVAVEALQATFPGTFGDEIRRYNKEKLEEIEQVNK